MADSRHTPSAPADDVERHRREIKAKVPPRVIYVLVHHDGSFHGPYRSPKQAKAARNNTSGWRIIRYRRGSLYSAGKAAWRTNRGIE